MNLDTVTKKLCDNNLKGHNKNRTSKSYKKSNSIWEIFQRKSDKRKKL